MKYDILAALPAMLMCMGAAAPERPHETPISLETLKEVTRVLASDEFEGRAPTTPGEEKTVNYLVQRFRDAGLQPGNKASWFQEVPLVESKASPTPLRVTGGRAPLTFEHPTDFVARSYRAQPSIELKDSDIVFVGYGINAPEKGWNDYAGVDVKGKTVLILLNDPDYQSADLNGPFNGKAMTYYGRWLYKFEEAARQGAAAALVIHDAEAASYAWGAVQWQEARTHYNMDLPGGQQHQSKVVGWMKNEAAARLLSTFGQDLAALTKAAQRKGFKAIPLGGKASMSMTNELKRQVSRNVVGILPGTERPNEYVLYMAHWDHSGRCIADATGDDICNGAVDNASGTAGLVALAEALGKAGPAERSQVFIAVTAEEAGLLGSAYYAEHPLYPLARTVGGINMDELRLFGMTRDLAITGMGKSELEDRFRKIGTELGFTVVREPSPEGGYYYRSDHFSLAKVGVPMLYAESGSDLVNGGRAAWDVMDQHYRAHIYHRPADEYNPSWDWSGALRDIDIYYRLGRELAMSNDWPNWYPGDEFRAIRDKSRAAAR